MKFLCFILINLLVIFDGIHVINGKRVKRIVGGIMAAQPPPDDPVVFVKLYSKDARVEGLRNVKTGLYSFLGIRFADPPIDENRFLRPRYRRLVGDINARSYPMPCPQQHPQDPNIIVGIEDCLKLNVFTPQMPDETTGLPVIIWIHGGGFRSGSANQYGTDPLTTKGVIVVPIQYRLGSLGIIGDGSREFSGNLALFDMYAAIRWVNEYISYFGGDPKQIKLMGQGSGATSAMYLSTSKIARSSITGVVAMSGTSFTQNTIDKNPKQSVEEVTVKHNCPTINETELLNCLRKKDVEEIIKQDSQLQMERLQGEAVLRSMTGMATFEPVQEQLFDQRSLPGFIDESPRDIIKNGTIKRIPLLLGVTKDETGNGINLPVIEKSFKSTNEFLATLTKSIQLDKIVGDLLNVNQILPGIDRVLPLTEYLNIPQSLGIDQIISKLVEATTDSLFNLPAALTADIWSKVAPAYLYSFEHKSERSKGANFLSGLPLVANEQKNNEIVGHGDDLGYLFDVQDIFGKPIENTELVNATDKKVRNLFTNLIAKFAHFDVNHTPKDDGIFSVFTTKGSPFIKITDEIALEKDFRACELALWGVPFKAISTVTCGSILDGLSSLIPLKGALNPLTKTLTGGNAGGGGLLSGVTGGNNNNKKSGGGLLGSAPIRSGGTSPSGTRSGGGGLLGLF